MPLLHCWKWQENDLVCPSSAGTQKEQVEYYMGDSIMFSRNISLYFKDLHKDKFLDQLV
jgi:hypothetical protein